MFKMPRAARALKPQMTLLINQIFQKKEMVNGNSRDPEITQMWENIVERINARGPEKSISEWKEVYKLAARKAKAKARRLSQSLESTSGGEGTPEILTPLEEKILDIEGRDAVFGRNIQKIEFLTSVQEASFIEPTEDAGVGNILPMSPVPSAGQSDVSLEGAGEVGYDPPPASNRGTSRAGRRRVRFRRRRRTTTEFVDAYSLASANFVEVLRDGFRGITSALLEIANALGNQNLANSNSGDPLDSS